MAAAVLLHPHPDFGGDQHNVVIEALWRVLGGAGVACTRFDFASSDVDACAAQAVAALDDLPAGAPAWVVGYSFGGLVGTHVVDERVAGWALVAPILDPAAPAGGDERPKLVLAAVHDQFTPPDRARAAVAAWPSTTVEDIESADHFLAGATDAVARRVLAVVTRDVPT
jgi:alpha/beta superfamily hydrolase